MADSSRVAVLISGRGSNMRALIERAEDFEAELDRALADQRVGTFALAGYMRILSPAFIGRWKGRIINIHPSLLPRHKGLDTHNRVLASGDKTSGCTVHLVSEELDSGDVIVHVFRPEVREFYNLERLWTQGPTAAAT